MNRYKIENIRNGAKFNVEAESLIRCNEYGLSTGIKLKSECDQWELDSGSDAGLNENNLELWSYPDSMNLINTSSIDAELATKETARQAKLAAIQSLKDCNPDAAATLDDLKAIVKDILKILNG